MGTRLGLGGGADDNWLPVLAARWCNRDGAASAAADFVHFCCSSAVFKSRFVIQEMMLVGL